MRTRLAARLVRIAKLLMAVDRDVGPDGPEGVPGVPDSPTPEELEAWKARLSPSQERSFADSNMVELDELSMDQYGRKYRDLPDDGPEQEQLVLEVCRANNQ